MSSYARYRLHVGPGGHQLSPPPSRNISPHGRLPCWPPYLLLFKRSSSWKVPLPTRKRRYLRLRQNIHHVHHTYSIHHVQVSQIETERLLADLVKVELDRRSAAGSTISTAFTPVCFYLGYQARSSMPSNFDCDLGYTLGETAAALCAAGATGYMATAHCLTSAPADWRVCGTAPRSRASLV